MKQPPMNHLPGWRLHSADFSLVARGTAATGVVMVIRAPECYERWQRLSPDAQRDHPLFITGRGAGFDEALVNAALAAVEHGPVPPVAYACADEAAREAKACTQWCGEAGRCLATGGAAA